MKSHGDEMDSLVALIATRSESPLFLVLRQGTPRCSRATAVASAARLLSDPNPSCPCRENAAARAPRGGFCTPATALGTPLREALHKAGIRFDELDELPRPAPMAKL